MRRFLAKLSLLSSAITLLAVGGSIVLALPAQANTHAQAASNNRPSNPSSQAGTKLLAAQLRACQNRENAINNIISRVDTRGQNQLNLFNTIATRVENFYTSRGNTAANYDQLVAAVNAAKTQAETDLSTMQSNSTFSCNSSNPKAMVTAFQGYLKTEITDLQNYRTDVKNLIVAVAKANGVTVSDSTQSSDQVGQ